MKKQIFTLFAVCLASLFIAGCFDDDDDSQVIIVHKTAAKTEAQKTEAPQQKTAAPQPAKATYVSNKKKDTASCIGNLKQLSMAIMMFRDENDGNYPKSIDELGQAYKGVSICTNGASKKAYTLEAGVTGDNSTTPVIVCRNHGDLEVVLYADGHVASRKK